MNAALHAQRLDPRTLDSADLDAWRSLADRAIEPNPYYRPEFVLANAQERDVPATLIVVRDGPDWLACLPVLERPPSRTLPLPHLQALTDAYTLCGTPLLDRDAIGPGSDALLEVVQAHRGAALLLDALPADGVVNAALHAAAAKRGIEPIVYQAYERAAWLRPPEGEPTGVRLKTSDRRIMNKRARQMRDELGGDLELVDRSDDPAAWDAFLDMERSGWKAEWGTAMGSTEADATFFRRMCAGMAATGHLDVVGLEVAGTTVAMECHLIDGTALYSFKIAYDPAYRRFSPGSQLSELVIERFVDQGLDLGDSCASPDNTHMNWLWPDQRRMQTMLLPTRAASSRLLRPALWSKSVARRIRDDLVRGRTR